MAIHKPVTAQQMAIAMYKTSICSFNVEIHNRAIRNIANVANMILDNYPRTDEDEDFWLDVKNEINTLAHVD